MESSEVWRTKALKSFAISKVEMQGRKSKENPAMKHSWWQSLQPLLEHFLISKLCIQYVIWKLRKSTIQCFKPCAIRSWNEEVTAFGRWLLQAEGRSQKSAAESAFCCGMVSQPFLYSAMEFPWSFTPRWKPNTTRWKSTLQRCWISWLLWRNFAALLVHLRNLADLTCHLRSGP